MCEHCQTPEEAAACNEPPFVVWKERWEFLQSIKCQVTAMQFLAWFRDVCSYMPRPRGYTGGPIVSNSEIRRWLESGSVWINGTRPKPNDLVEMGGNMGARQLVFFPGSPSQCTFVWDDEQYPADWLQVFFGTHPKQIAAAKKKAEKQKADKSK